MTNTTNTPAAAAVVPPSLHDLNTSAGGRGYIAEYFSKHLRRYDFERYIHERLAADFACVLAKHLESAAPAAQASPMVMHLTLNRTLGGVGAAFDPPGPRRAYTYQHQPNNQPAYRLGLALSAADAPRGDAIDGGLGLLKALEEHGFGVVEIEAAAQGERHE